MKVNGEKSKDWKKHYEQRRKEKLENGKICPFMSTPDKQVPCTEACKLHRHTKTPGYECYLMELQSMSYYLKGLLGNDVNSRH